MVLQVIEILILNCASSKILDMIHKVLINFKLFKVISFSALISNKMMALFFLIMVIKR
jgi:hypothetical protein